MSNLSCPFQSKMSLNHTKELDNTFGCLEKLLCIDTVSNIDVSVRTLQSIKVVGHGVDRKEKKGKKQVNKLAQRRVLIKRHTHTFDWLPYLELTMGRRLGLAERERTTYHLFYGSLKPYNWWISLVKLKECQGK